MQHPDRDNHESAFAAKLKGLNAALKRELAQLVGNPPNFANVPPSFWVKAEEEYRAEIIAALYLIHLENEIWHAGDVGGVRQRDLGDELIGAFEAAAETYANGRGQDTAAKAIQTAQGRWQSKAGALAARQAAGDDVSRSDALEAIDETLPDSQADMVAKSETTAAQTAGGDVGVDQTVGVSPEDRWRNRPDLSRSGPCQICEPLDGLLRKEWPPEYANGPGPEVHPGCVCDVLYANAVAA